MRNSHLFLLAFLCACATSACGGAERPEAETSDEPVPSSAQTVDIPDFVIPAPPGALRVMTHTDDQLMLDYPLGDLERIVEFYDEWTTSEPASFTRTDNGDEGATWITESVDRSIIVQTTGPSDRKVVAVLLGAS